MSPNTPSYDLEHRPRALQKQDNGTNVSTRASGLLVAEPTFTIAGNLETQPSSIHGLGLFCKQDIKRLALIWREKLRDRLSLAYSNDGPLRWANHSADPNANLVLQPSEHGATLDLVALRDIPHGQEITYDYGAFGHTGDQAECNCGSSDCPGSFTLRKDWGEKK
jgi:hypothetical protein